MALGEVTKDTGASSVSPQAGEITPSTYQEDLSAIMLGYTQYNLRDNTKQEKLVSGSNIRTINGVSVLGSGNISISSSVDTALSTTSTNPVQNKVVTAALDDKLGRKGILDVKGDYFVIRQTNGYYINLRGDGYAEVYDSAGDRVSLFYFPNSDYDSDDMLATMSDVSAATDNKVDKVAGKGLSTNDYTTAEKNKLAGLKESCVVSMTSDSDGYLLDAEGNKVTKAKAVEAFNSGVLMVDGYKVLSQTVCSSGEDGYDCLVAPTFDDYVSSYMGLICNVINIGGVGQGSDNEYCTVKQIERAAIVTDFDYSSEDGKDDCVPTALAVKNLVTPFNLSSCTGGDVLTLWNGKPVTDFGTVTNTQYQNEMDVLSVILNRYAPTNFVLRLKLNGNNMSSSQNEYACMPDSIFMTTKDNRTGNTIPMEYAIVFNFNFPTFAEDSGGQNYYNLSAAFVVFKLKKDNVISYKYTLCSTSWVGDTAYSIKPYNDAVKQCFELCYNKFVK